MSDTPGGDTRPSLLARIAGRDEEAWGEFDSRYRPLILAWCRSHGLQESDAEEVVQRVMLRLVEKMRAFVYDSDGSFRAWLMTLTRHAWCELEREQGRPGQGSGDSAVARLVESQEAREDLVARLAEQFDLDLLEEARCRVRRRVEPATWQAYALTAEEGRTGAEAAARTGLHVEQVYVAKCRVLKLLTEEVQRLQG
jgi:RNA polymerase sigma-70 factor (ECF subfamily)